MEVGATNRRAVWLAVVLAVGALTMAPTWQLIPHPLRESFQLRAGDVMVVRVPRGSLCVQLVVQVPHDTVVTVDLQQPGMTCPSGLVVFRHGPITIGRGDGDPQTIVYLDRDGVVPVPIRFWILTDSPMVDSQWIASMVEDLQNSYAANRAGVVFVNAGVTKIEHPSEYLLSGCMQNDLDSFVEPTNYFRDALNVYVVDSIHGFGTQDGLTCFDQRVGGNPATNVIFWSLLYHSDATLPHEIGHAFGLQSLTCGHVKDLIDRPGCDAIQANNLMLQKEAAPAPSPWLVRDHFTLGQVYRMNLDSISFLNLAGLRGGRPVKVCQVTCCNAADGCAADRGVPCLKLTVDLPGGGQ